MRPPKLTVSLTNFILVFLLIFMQTSAWSDHDGFTAALSVTDVVDDGNPNSIGVESRKSTTPFTNAHDVEIPIVVSFSKKIKSADLTAADFDADFFNKFDEEVTDPPTTLNNLLRFPTTVENGKYHTFFIVPRILPTNATVITLILKKGAVGSVERADIEAVRAGRIESVPTNESTAITLSLVREEPTDGTPKVVSMSRYDSKGFLTPDIAGPFIVKIVLTEKPKAFTAEHIEVTNGRVTSITAVLPFGGALAVPDNENGYFVEKPPIAEGYYTHPADIIPEPTGRDYRYHLYYVRITPDLKTRDDVVVKIKEFEDTVNPSNRYIPLGALSEKRTQLTVKVGARVTIIPTPGFPVALPHSNNASIPVNGFYILTKDYANSGLASPPPLPHYNVRENSELPDLENFLRKGGIIDLVGPVDISVGSVVISEVLWGQDWNLADASESQWVELYNITGTRLPISENSWFLHFYELGEPVPSPFTPGIIDRIGTLDRSRTPWAIFDKGQSGGVKIQPLISMERLVYTTKQAADGTKASSWIASPRASHNVELTTSGRGITTPGFINLSPLPKPVIPPPPKDTIIPIAGRRDIVISEIMYAMKIARLPQWIELHNTSNKSVNLKGWKVTIENDPEDETVLETDLTFTLNEMLVGANQAVLLVTEQGRSSGIGNDFDDLRKDRVIILKSLLGIETTRYKLLSTSAFKVTLTPPSGTRPGDTAGNLGADPPWELPNTEGEERSSIIRNYGLKSDGMAADEWLLASEQVFQHAQHDTYYGLSNDYGTPGYRAGNPLPVQLSSFHPEPTETGAIVIRWTTESELDNAGFNILRSMTRDGVFSLVNPTLIPGAGTTGEKHTYSFTDTTVAPNIVYYYRIEDVSFAGTHRTLVTVRLKGYISAADRLTTTWGHLKTED